MTAPSKLLSSIECVDEPRAELQRALALEHPTERKLAVVSLIDELVQRIEWRAIVIGGLAVEFWTRGAYSTTDIDLYLPHGPAVDDLLAEVGFRKEGRHWVLREHELFVEAPASFPAEAEDVVEVELGGGRLAASTFPRTSSRRSQNACNDGHNSNHAQDSLQRVARESRRRQQ